MLLTNQLEQRQRQKQVAGPECHPGGCRGYGNPEAKVVLIGIAPGQDETSSGKPFTGPSGRLLDAVLQAVGYPRELVYTTNLICFWKNLPSPQDIEGCRERLVKEVRDIGPKLIIPLGQLAYEMISGREMSRNRGRPYFDKKEGWYVMGTYHPSGFLRGASSLIVDIVKDLQKIPMILAWPDDGSVADVRYTIVQSAAEAQAVLDGLPKQETNINVSLDIETNYGEEEIDIFNEEVRCIAVSWGHDFTVVIPERFLKELVWPLDVNWAFQNGMFDVNGLRRHYGIVLPIANDTLLQSYSLDERGGVHSLDDTAGEFCGAEHYKEVFKVHRRRGLSDDSFLWEYNAKDTAYTWRLVPTFTDLQRRDNVYDLYRNEFIPLANIFADLSYQGINVDQGRIAELALEWLPRWLEQEQELKDLALHYGWIGDINVASHQQLGKLIFQVLGLSMPFRYSKQKQSTRVEVLELMDHPFIDRLLDFRQLDHMVSNYLINIKDQIKLDGRVHPDVLIHGSRTGRPSYRNPPLQTIPQPYSVGDDLSRIKEIFVPDSDEYVLLEADYKQIEVYLAAFLSQDKQMLADLASGDFHSSTAAGVVARLPLEEFLLELKSDDRTIRSKRVKDRFQAKKVTFGNFYRQGADSLARKRVADCTIAEAQQMLVRWRARYSGYEEWANRIMQQATDNGELVTVTGRKRRFRVVHGDESHHMLRQSVNFPIQATANDYLLLSLIDLYWELANYGARALVTVHDSILFNVRKDRLQETALFIKSVMEGVKWAGWPSIEVELKVGDSWGQMKSYDSKKGL